jgi:hypothetical protein
MSDRPRYLAPTSSGRSYTTLRHKAMQGEPEPVSDAWLSDSTGDVRTTHEKFTVRRAAEHGIRVVLRHDGATDSNTVKARVAEVIGCDARTVERAAADMTDLHRKRGQHSQTTWSLLTSDSTGPKSEKPISTNQIRHQIEELIWGARQEPIAPPREIAAELLADELIGLMEATEHYYKNGNG